MGFLTPDTPALPSPQAPAPVPTPQAPQGAKPKRKSQQQTFIADTAAPEGGTFAGKTLLGQ